MNFRGNQMKIQKRIRPLMRVGEVFQIPQIFLIPGMLVSCGLIPLSLMADSVPSGTVIGAGFAAVVFGILVFFVVALPVIYAIILSQNGVETTAAIIKKEKRGRWLMTSDSSVRMLDSYVTFEFTPANSSAPLRLEAEVGKVYTRLSEGKTAKIRYARSNPRIVKFIGE
jgi:hypothetical protein